MIPDGLSNTYLIIIGAATGTALIIIVASSIWLFNKCMSVSIENKLIKRNHRDTDSLHSVNHSVHSEFQMSPRTPEPVHRYAASIL